MIFFNVKEVRDFLTRNRVVYTLRKPRRAGRDLAVYGNFRKFKRIGMVHIKFIGIVTNPKQLEPYVAMSGLTSVGEWLDKAKQLSGGRLVLYKVTLL